MNTYLMTNGLNERCFLYRIHQRKMKILFSIYFLSMVSCMSAIPLMTNRNSFLSSSKRSCYANEAKLNRAVKFLEVYGYLTILKKPSTHTLGDVQAGIKRFQNKYKLNESAFLDKVTIAKMKEPRCGMPDNKYIVSEEDVINGYQADDPMTNASFDKRETRRKYEIAGRWQKTDIKYRFGNYAKDLSIAEQRREIRNAFHIWSEETPLSFKEVSSNDEDILIYFLTGFHGDKYPFDGRGSKLAHAFFPGQGEKSGHMHFDGDEKWTANTGKNDDGTNLYAVAAHEIGHALGLSHSFEPDSIMSPFYRTTSSKLVLGKGDRAVIERMYCDDQPAAMVAKTESRNAPEVYQHSGEEIQKQGLSAEETSTDSLCDYKFDAVVNVRNDLFFIKDNSFWRLNEQGKLVDESSAQMSSFWNEFPDVRVDAAFTRPSDQDIVFISGNKYWVYADNTKLETQTPQPICDFGICDVESIDAAVVWDANKQIYIFKGAKFWKLDDNLKAEIGYPKNISTLLGVPDNLDSAVRDPDGYTYFIKDKSTWKFDDSKLSVSEGYPRYTGERWFGCNSSFYESKTSATPREDSSNEEGSNSACSIYVQMPAIYWTILLWCTVIKTVVKL